jgi:superfamily II DNA or RNA helicase
MVKVYKREAVFIPIKDIPKKNIDRVKEKLSFRFFEERSCKKCDNLPYRMNDLCEQCPAYKGGYDLASQVTVKETKYLKIPVGSSAGILDYLNGQHIATEVIDKSPQTKIKTVNFTGTLKPEQEEAVQGVIAKVRGVLRAPPRSGKTVMATAVACRLRVKTLILASQRDWLMGFHETFVGSKTQAPLTDLAPERIKLCKTLADFESTDICLATVQTFYSEKGEELLRKLRDVFTLVIVDEVHTSAADKYVRILSKINFKYGVGLSGTPARKDGKYVLVENIMGPITHEVDVKGLRPRILMTKTKYQKAYKGQVPWARMVSALENDEKRLKLIAEMAIKDAEAGHMVMIPFSQVKPITRLIKLINDKAGKTLAYPFTGQLKKTVRDETIQKAREYKIKILVGTLKIMSTGINIPRASMLYEVALSSNLPNAEQRMRRVLTPLDGKPDPAIRYFLDDMNVRKNCMRAEYFGVMLPKMKPILTDDDRQLLKSYFSERTHEKFEL